MFARRGYDRPGSTRSPPRPGYSKGALYWHFSGKEDLLLALLEERIDAPDARDGRAAAVRAAGTATCRSRRLGRSRDSLREQREVVLLDREYWSLAIRDPELRARYIARQTDLRRALARALEARMRQLGTPDLPMAAEQLARIVMSIIAGLAIDELIEPGSVDPGLLGDTLAVLYSGLTARASQPRGG